MPGDDDAPLSSYSDPLYDRLDAISRQVRRLWWLFALSIIAIALGAAAFRLWMHREPTAASAALAIDATEAQQRGDTVRRDELWSKLADGADYEAGFRAAACMELTQSALNRGDGIQARKRAQEAEDHARRSGDQSLLLAAGLSRAAALLDEGKATEAFELYQKTSTGAGTRHPARQFEAELGAARCLEKQGKIDDAMLRLEPLLTWPDEGAKKLVEIARSNYWRLKRTKAGEPIPVAKPPEAKPTAEVKPLPEAKPAVVAPAVETKSAEAKPAVVAPAVEAKPEAKPTPEVKATPAPQH